MGKSQRVKGATAEREVAAIFRSHNLGGRRTGQMQAQNGAPETDVEIDVAGVHLEVKRQETTKIDAWCEQARRDAPEGVTPVVVYRRSRQPWRVVLELDDYIDLLKRAG